MWELDHKESWVPKNWYFWTVVLEKTLESPLDFKEIKPVSPKGNQSWIFIGRTDDEVEAPLLWLPKAKCWLLRKDPDVGEDWRQEEKGMTEDAMVGSPSPSWWTWIWASSGSCWWTGKPGLLQFMGSQSRACWVTELNWIVTAVGISSSIIITTIFNFIMLLSLLCSLMSPIFLKSSLVFPILLYSSTLRCSPKKAFLTPPCYFLELCIQLGTLLVLFSPCPSLLFFFLCYL